MLDEPWVMVYALLLAAGVTWIWSIAWTGIANWLESESSRPLLEFVFPFTHHRVTLSVFASGTPPLTYQWKQNGVDLPGATNAVCPVITVLGTNTYNCVVANAFTPPATSGPLGTKHQPIFG